MGEIFKVAFNILFYCDWKLFKCCCYKVVAFTFRNSKNHSIMRPEARRKSAASNTEETLTYLYKHLVDVDGILGTGFDEDGMDGVGIVLGILLWYLPGNTRGTFN